MKRGTKSVKLFVLKQLFYLCRAESIVKTIQLIKTGLISLLIRKIASNCFCASEFNIVNI